MIVCQDKIITVLPEITEADLPDVLSTEILEQENKKAKVKVNIYNPAGETIQKIIVKNLTSQNSIAKLFMQEEVKSY